MLTLRTADVLSKFPGEREAVTVERIGETIILNETASNQRPKTSRGRPSYPWDSFHVEVTAVLQKNELPNKKEAAIEYFQAWFERVLKIRPSRAAIGEKLTPYYARFVRGADQKR